MIKRVLLLLSFISIAVFAEPFSKMATVEPVLVQKGDKKMWCAICGMNLKMFYKTSYIAGDKQYCSVRCLVADNIKNHNIDFNKVEVIDVKTQKPILAKDAIFVVGSDVKGTMSRVSKLAFSSKADAEEFIKAHGGKVATFDEVLKMAKDTLIKDTKMVMVKKQKMMYPMGKKILAKKCNGADIDISKFKAVNELKAYIKKGNLCKNISERQLQAVALYLWDKKRDSSNLKVKITKKDRCPVCGMFVYKYPKWVAQIVYRDGERLSFDGVKDMMKFYFNRNRYGKYENLTKDKIVNIIVTDYYTQKPIDATKAYYVIGSDINGPMGEELIPFTSLDSAKTFLHDHYGKKILKFSEITPDYLK